MLDLHPSPVRVTSEAAHKLPRFLLLAALIIFALSGLFGRDLWSAEESEMLGEVLGMLSADSASWLFPWAFGKTIVEHGPLAVWIAALFAKAGNGFFSALTCMRATTLLWFGIATASIWYGTWFLARRKEAQSVSLVFARKAAYRDYGRLVADSATLFVISLFGLIVHLHEPVLSTVEFALASLAFFGCAWSLTRPYWGSALSGFACGLLMLASSLIVSMTLLGGCLIAHVFVHGIGRLNRKLLTTLFAALLTFLLWPAAAHLVASEIAGDYFNLWAHAQIQNFGIINPSELAWLTKHFVWYLCPAWPFAVLALWRWRRNLTATHIAMPASFLVAWIAGLILSEDIGAETLLSTVIGPFCVLAAFGLMSSQRNARSMLECFSVAVFTLALLGVWIYWGAWTLEWPSKMHYSIWRLVADESQAHSGILGVVFALVATVFWVQLCLQRLSRHPTVLWKGPWLSATGITVLWITVVGLFGPAIDSNRTYANIAHEMYSELQTQGFVNGVDCVRASGLKLAERTAIYWHSGVNITESKSESCRFYLDHEPKDGVSEHHEGIVLKSFRPRSDIRYRVGKMAPVLPKL